jgi:hypothetical protein
MHFVLISLADKQMKGITIFVLAIVGLLVLLFPGIDIYNGESTIDIHVHDTYYVFSKPDFIFFFCW